MNAVEWIESRSGLSLRPWQRAAVLAMFPEDGSPSPWETFLLSTIKKTGKTTLNAWCTLYAAVTFPSGETAYVMANDAEQAEENCFSLIAAAVREAGLERSGAAVVRADRVVFAETGTRIVALPADFAGSAGARFGISSWTELWAYRYEAHVRLWEELTPNPNRRSLRIVDSYAGFRADAPVLEPLWARALAGERVAGDLPIYTAGRLWAFLDQGEEAQARGWLGDPADMDAYYAEQRASLRSGTFNRLHMNAWQEGEEAFITAPEYDACVVSELRPVASDSALPVFVGIDAATKRDCAAVVAVARLPRTEGGDGQDRYRLVAHRIWSPQALGGTLDLEDTIEAYVLELNRRFRVRVASYDPHQMVRSAQTLKKQGVRVEPYNQTSGNLTASGQTLWDLLNSRAIQLYPDTELRRHCLNAVAIYSSRGWRIAKEKASQKVDGCVALSFAVLAAVERGSGGSWRPMFTQDEAPELRRKGFILLSDGRTRPLSPEEAEEQRRQAEERAKAERESRPDPFAVYGDPDEWVFR